MTAMVEQISPVTVALVAALLSMKETIDTATEEEQIWTYPHYELELEDPDLPDNILIIPDEDVSEQLRFTAARRDGFDLNIHYSMVEGDDVFQDYDVDIRYDPPSVRLSEVHESTPSTEMVYDLVSILTLLCLSTSGEPPSVRSGKKERLVQERRASMRLVSATEMA